MKEAVTVSAAPQMFPSDTKGEWLVVGGFAPFEKSGAKGVAVLYTASGHGKMVNALVLTNTQAYEADITAFLESVSLKKPAVENQLQVPANQNDSQPSLTGNFWKKGGISKGLLGHADLSPGTFSDTYHFFSNGTYKFTKVNSQYTAPKWYLEDEEGTYTVNGNTITITPKKARFSQHRINREDPPLKSGNLPLSTVQYRFEFWKSDGNWRLLLSPVDGNETKRDGTFSFWRNGEAQRTYQYNLVDAKGNLIQ
ncbi:MAG TPA: lipocalin family protein [Pyrinomonadaceae bacterium]|nr:lipocalin family protein [Pyrinomonadaceae bacterium]